MEGHEAVSLLNVRHLDRAFVLTSTMEWVQPLQQRLMDQLEDSSDPTTLGKYLVKKKKPWAQILT